MYYFHDIRFTINTFKKFNDTFQKINIILIAQEDYFQIYC